MTRPRYEVADVLNRHAAQFLREQGRSVSARVASVLTRLQLCRTAALGGHKLACTQCGDAEISYNSCRDRHCPKCGAGRRAQWLAAQTQNLMPVPYFHIVFTMPHELGPLALQNERVVYGILFRAASQTLLQLGADEKHLGARIGVSAVLHTWGQNLEHHPHVHCVVTGGGLSLDEDQWVVGRRRFFISVRVMRKLFRGKFLAALDAAYRNGELELHGRLAHLRQPPAFARLIRKLRKKKWVVYAKPPFGGPERVLKYLARYTHRVAISNHRITAIDATTVAFRWKDYRDGQCKIMVLRPSEFIRRFAIHVLPKGLMRIRHYGILANSKRADALEKVRLLAGPLPPPTEDVATAKAQEHSEQDATASRCDQCGGPLVSMLVVATAAGATFYTLWWDTS